MQLQEAGLCESEHSEEGYYWLEEWLITAAVYGEMCSCTFCNYSRLEQLVNPKVGFMHTNVAQVKPDSPPMGGGASTPDC